MKGTLIGDPVNFSTSDRLYPILYNNFGIKGSFEKVRVPKGELKPFFEAADFDFITVTMPHKVDVISFCDSLSSDAKAIGSVNYIAVIDGRREGQNFDGMGTLDPIEKRILVKDKLVVVVGAGGAARAAIYEAKKRGAKVICVNRTKEKGVKVAKELNVSFSDTIPNQFDVLINATSVGMNPLDDRCIVPDHTSFNGKVVLDMASRTGACKLNAIVSGGGGVYISGSEMFYALSIYGLSFLLQKNKQLHFKYLH